MDDALRLAGPLGLLVVAMGLPLWRARDTIRPWHLGLLLGAGLLAAAAATSLRGVMILALPLGIVAELLLVQLVMAALFWLIARRHSAGSGQDIHRGHAVRFGSTDFSRSHGVPQLVALLTAGLLVKVKSGLFVVALAVATWLAALSWVAAQHRLRLMRHTPTSRLASAAQGLVEVSGLGRPVGGQPLTSPLRRHPCIWFRYKVEEKRGSHWRTVEAATSIEPFLLDDGSATVRVEPEGALVQDCRKRSWRTGRRLYTEEWLLPNARLYVLGELASENPVARALDARQDVGNLLAQWKGDPAALAQRFDADGDGDVSLAEWQAARASAERQVAARHAELRAMPAVHVLRAPGGQRPFVIGNATEDELLDLARRGAMLRMSWFALLLGGTAYAAVRQSRRALGTARR